MCEREKRAVLYTCVAGARWSNTCTLTYFFSSFIGVVVVAVAVVVSIIVALQWRLLVDAPYAMCAFFRLIIARQIKKFISLIDGDRQCMDRSSPLSLDSFIQFFVHAVVVYIDCVSIWLQYSHQFDLSHYPHSLTSIEVFVLFNVSKT